MADSLIVGHRAKQRVHRVDDPCILGGKRCDRRPQDVARKVGDLQRIQNNALIVDDEMRPEITVGEIKRLGGY